MVSASVSTSVVGASLRGNPPEKMSIYSVDDSASGINYSGKNNRLQHNYHWFPIFIFQLVEPPSGKPISSFYLSQNPNWPKNHNLLSILFL